MLFLSSDGITDQNNPERKRYGSQRLNDLIIKIVQDPLIQQKESIESDLKNFQQNAEQRDDITLIGIKIKY